MTEKLSEAKLAENLRIIRENIAAAAARGGRSEKDVRLMAVTKTVSPELVNAAIRGGVDLLGENRVQEYLEKRDSYLPAEVHMIGHLQTNKVKYIIDKVSMIESVDSLKLAREIDRCASRAGKVMDVLIEVNVGGELSKSGTAPQDAMSLVEQIAELSSVRIRGLMTIPPICSSKEQSMHYFSLLRQIAVDISAKNSHNVSMEFLSMGMSHDYEAAVEMGANIVRIGSALFGQRNYQ